MSIITCWCISPEHSPRGGFILAGGNWWTFPRGLLGEMWPLRPDVPSGLGARQLHPGSRFVHREGDSACLLVCIHANTLLCSQSCTHREGCAFSYDNTMQICARGRRTLSTFSCSASASKMSCVSGDDLKVGLVNFPFPLWSGFDKHEVCDDCMSQLPPPPTPTSKRQSKPFRVKYLCALFPLISDSLKWYNAVIMCAALRACGWSWIFSLGHGGKWRKREREWGRDKVGEGEGGGLLQGESKPSLYRHCDARWLLLINIQP